MPSIHLSLLTPQDLEQIHQTSFKILRQVGIIVHHPGVLLRLGEGGARIDPVKKTARFDEELVMSAVAQAGKQFIIHGRDPQKIARFGYGDFNLMSSPGQYSWFDWRTGMRREPVLADAIAAVQVGEALANVSICGAMSVPSDVPLPVRDVVTFAAMAKVCSKPLRVWPVSRRSSHYLLEICAAIAGGKQALRENPLVETFLEPISPLQLPETGLDVVLEFLDYGQPVSFGPMVMAGGSGPVTLAGTLAQENAEILAGITTVQILAPGTPVMYGGIPHIMDPRTSICSFGSPEQGLMALAMTEIGKSYVLPVYINVNLSDAKTLDAQAGMEKMSGLLLGMLAGADLYGHGGILGTDHGGSLPWLVVDNEAFNYARRVVRGFSINEETLALPVIEMVGPAGNYLAETHTVKHLRQEIWAPNRLWTRQAYDPWLESGATEIGQRASTEVDRILEQHPGETIDPVLSREIDLIVEAAKKELL